MHGYTLAVLDRGGGAPLHVVRERTAAQVKTKAGAAPGVAFTEGSREKKGWSTVMSLAALKSRPGYLKGNQLRIRVTFT